MGGWVGGGGIVTQKAERSTKISTYLSTRVINLNIMDIAMLVFFPTAYRK